MQPSDNTYKMMANSPSASQQQRAQQQQQMVQAAVRMQQSPQQQQQQQQHDRQQRQQMMLNQSYAPNQQAMASSHMHSMMLTSSQDHTTSPMAFRWPPTMQQPSQQQLQQGGQTGDSIFGNMNFSADLFNDTSQADAEIEAILSNYQPRPYSNVPVDGAVRGVSLPDSTLSSQPRSSQMMHQNSLPSSSSSASMGGMRHDHVDPINSAATAAAAAYSHLGYGGGSYRMDDSQSSGTSEIDQKDNRIKVNGASHPLRHGYSGAAGERTIAYDGDASNTSSSHTPGGASSGEDSMGGKRRRMTVGGIEAVQQQTRYEAGLSTGGADGKGAAVSQASGGKGGRPIMQHHGTSTVDSRSLEKMAQHSLKQAGKDNARAHTLNLSANPNRPTPNRPAFRHRRSHSGSNVPIASSSTSTVTLQNAHNVNASQGGSVAPTKRLSGPLNTGPQSASSMQQRSASGYAAAQSLSNGDQVQRRPVDMTPIGSSAATDFTKRKGWPTRIVEELLDFVHVLDREGRVLFASPSVLTLTGWRAEELTGKPLTDFVHQDDVSSVQFEFQRSLQERSEMTMYYRFRRKPQTAADKQRVREQREAQQTTRSRSGSASGGDSSSNQEANKASTFATGSFDNAYITGKMESLEEEGELTDDLPDKYVIFEATGHPYISPHGSFPEAEPMGEKIVEQILPKLAANHLASQSSSDKSDVQPKDSIDGSDDEIQCFFCSCRVYPTKNVGMLDSFLELKLENERLRMLLSEMSVSDGPARQGGGDAGSDGRRSLDESQIGYHLDYMHELEQQHQQQSDATPNRQRNSLGHGTSSFPPPFHVTETMTGNEVQNALARKGSISQSVHDSSNPVSPTLNRSFDKPTNDGAGEESDDLASPNANSTAEEKRRKKKVKPEEGDYVCTDCGRVDSPEWRKGPLGPKTLCNACGLRWAKKVKRSGGDPNAIAMAARPAKGQIKAQAAAARAQKQNLQFQQENGDATQTGPPPLSSNPGVGLLYSSQTSPSQFSTSFSHLYDDGSMNHMSGHEFLNSAAMRLDPSMQQHHQQQGGHPNYSPYQ